MNLQALPPVTKKRKKKTAKSSSSPPSFSLLPDEITENCLARVPRSYYPKLSLVSKSFRSLLSSAEIYAARSRLGITQQCLYVCLSSFDSSYRNIFQWIALSIDPNRTKKEKKKKTLGQLSVPIPCSSFATDANPTVVGSEIYIIGGYNAPSSTVRVLDYRSHVWRDAPSMNVARISPVSCFYDGKIYVMGGVKVDKSPFAEVFDTKTLSWECLPDPSAEVRRPYLNEIVEIEGEIHIRYGYNLYAYYDPKQRKWGEKNATFPWSECVMDNLLYSFGKHGITGPYNLWWRDMNGGNSKEVKGLFSLGNRYKRRGGSDSTRTKLATCGGKLYLMWAWYKKEYNPNCKVKICCVEISLEKRDGGEIWGNVEWLDVVHTTTTPCRLLHCLAISV